MPHNPLEILSHTRAEQLPAPREAPRVRDAPMKEGAGLTRIGSRDLIPLCGTAPPSTTPTPTPRTLSLPALSPPKGPKGSKGPPRSPQTPRPPRRHPHRRFPQGLPPGPGNRLPQLNRVLAQLGGDKEKAAIALGISLATLYRKLSEDDRGN